MVQIRQLRNPATKVLLSVGGWDIGSAPFSRLVASKDALTVFAESAAIFLRETGFDGLDVDWQYPANRGSPPNDRERFTRFLQVDNPLCAYLVRWSPMTSFDVKLHPICLILSFTGFIKKKKKCPYVHL